MKKNPLVSVIIVNFNEAEYTRQCLTSLQKQSYPNIEIIVVDNGSNDDSVKVIKKFPRIKLIQNKSNLGFATPNNQGVKEAKGEYIFLLNNDAYVQKDTIKKVIEYMEKNSKVGVVQNKILLAEKPELTDSTGSFFTKTGFLIHEGHAQPDSTSKKPKEVFSIKGASMFARKSLIEKIGLFDDNYFAYFEETDFCWRVLLAGFEVIYLPISTTYHHLGKTSRKQNPSFIQFHSFKNRLNSLIKNLSFFNLLYILPLHLFLISGMAFFNLILLKPRNSFGILKAILWNFTHIFSTLNKRKKIQKQIRSIKDSYIFNKVAKPMNLRWAVNFARLYLKS